MVRQSSIYSLQSAFDPESVMIVVTLCGPWAALCCPCIQGSLARLQLQLWVWEIPLRMKLNDKSGLKARYFLSQSPFPPRVPPCAGVWLLLAGSKRLLSWNRWKMPLNCSRRNESHISAPRLPPPCLSLSLCAQWPRQKVRDIGNNTGTQINPTSHDNMGASTNHAHNMWNNIQDKRMDYKDFCNVLLKRKHFY